MLRVGVVNQSSRVDADSFVAMVEACETQAAQVRIWWGETYRVAAYDTVDAVPSDQAPIVVLDNSDQVDALGWHDVLPDGRPYGRVFAAPVLDNGGSLLDGALSVSSVLSHEVVELACDPGANLWADDGTGVLWPREACDAVESLGYPLPVAHREVWVSDFVTPAFFVSGSSGPWDALAELGGPFRLASGGYTVQEVAGEPQTEWGDVPQWRRDTKDHQAARTARRVAQIVSRNSRT